MKLNNNQIKRYSRQIILKDIGPLGQKILLNSSVLVVGAGGLGSPALIYLAGIGIGNIAIIDYDNVDISNIHRQILGCTIRSRLICGETSHHDAALQTPIACKGN